jgi:hypothetical protein
MAALIGRIRLEQSVTGQAARPPEPSSAGIHPSAIGNRRAACVMFMKCPIMTDLERSHAELRTALILAAKEIRKLNAGKSDTPVLHALRRVLLESRAAAIRQRLGDVLARQRREAKQPPVAKKPPAEEAAAVKTRRKKA